MKKRQLLILLIAAVVIGGAALVVMNRQQAATAPKTSTEDDNGKKVFPDLDPNAVTAITIAGDDQTVELKRDDAKGIWVVASSHGYPADFAKLAPVVRKLDELEVTQTVDAGEKDYARLELLAPDAEGGAEEKGARIELQDADGKALAAFVMGKQHQQQNPDPQMAMMGGYGNGRYLRLLPDNRVVLVKESFWDLRADSSAWLNKDFIKLQGKMQKAVASQGDQTLWTLERANNSGKLTLVGDVPEDMEPNTTKIDNVDRALNYPRFTSVADPAMSAADLGLDDPRRFVADTFDGWHYELAIGSKQKNGEYPVKVAVAYTAPPMPAAPEDETPEDKTKRETEYREKVEKAEKEAAGLRRRLDGWVYLLPAYTADDLLYSRDDLLKKVEKKADEDTDAAAAPAPPAPTATPDPTEVEPAAAPAATLGDDDDDDADAAE